MLRLRGDVAAFVTTGALLLTVAVHRSALGNPKLPSARAYADRFRRPTDVPAPADNATTPARVRLGKTLFFDPRVSGSMSTSCASCHNPGMAWGDGLPRAIGNRMATLARRTPTILNTAWAAALFWDGRAESLEAQALGPIQAPGEMNMPLDGLVQRIAPLAGYREMFRAAYPGDSISAATIAKAIASFERTVISGDAPFDRWVRGDETAISTDAKRGFVLFNGKAGCATCHSGWRFTDDSFHDIGVAGTDSGRARVMPGIDGTEFAFKTPTLRNVDQRYPYMHDGSEATLDDVIDLYDRGGRVRRPSIADEIKPLHLTADQKRSLRAFLATLTSRDTPVSVPTLPR